ncbi:recombinase [Alicyclobacillus fodiniaquatilis]|uniref:Recombinase n=1 Tax=Alicyclobacillus fodiniaquatilis TaxID=1661150 RepID=A0ABW4JG59_9BACL
MRFIGLDVGNGSIGMCIRPSYGRVQTDIYPSAYAVYDNTLLNVSTGQRTKKQPNVFTFDNTDYVLGSDVRLAGAKAINAYDREDRYNRPQFQTLTKLALLDAATKNGSTGVIEVELALGTPAEDYRVAVTEELNRWFEAPVVGYKNQQRVEVHVKRLEIASQPIAVLMDSYLDDWGFVSNEELENMKVLVIDSGSGTLDFSEFDGMNLIKQVSAGIGMNDVYQDILNVIRSEFPKVRADVFELEAQLRECDDSDTKYFKYGQMGERDITPIYKKAMDEAWERMLGAIGVNFPDRFHLDKVILAGGTGQAFAKYYRSFMSDIEIPVRPDLSIARGLCKQVLANTAFPITP